MNPDPDILFNYIKKIDHNIIQIKTINSLDSATFDMLNNNGYIVRYYTLNTKWNDDVILVSYNDYDKYKQLYIRLKKIESL